MVVILENRAIDISFNFLPFEKIRDNKEFSL